MIVVGESAPGGDEVRPQSKCSSQSLGPTPPGDLGVVARSQHGRDGPTPELGGAGVVGIFEQAIRERLFGRRLIVAQNTGHQPGDGLENQQGTDLTTGQHHITDGDLPVDQMLSNPLVDPFVAAALKRESSGGRQLTGHLLVESPAGG